MNVPADLIHAILSNSPNLEELMLINSQQLNYQTISLESLPKLKHLELGSCTDIDDAYDECYYCVDTSPNALFI
jgi:hypothetical protein